MATKTKSVSAPVAEYASAMDKLRDEMAKANDPWIDFLGEEMTKLLLDHPEWENAILAEGKTLKGLYQAFYDRAKKEQKKGAYFGVPKVAQELVCGYYGVKAELDVPKAEQNVPKAEQNVTAPEPKPADPFDLDALLGVM